ncbi:MAG: hypothetical protein Q9200_000762 [Gallowayella weberi]
MIKDKKDFLPRFEHFVMQYLQHLRAFTLVAMLGSWLSAARVIDHSSLEPRQDQGTDSVSVDIVLLPDAPTDGSDTTPTPPPNQPLSKRATSWRAINQCPSQAGPRARPVETYFGGSRCYRDAGDQDWIISCGTDANHLTNYDGECQDNELCMDGVQTARHPDTAYCVQHENYVNIVNILAKGTQQKSTRTTLSGYQGNDYVLESIVSGKNGPNDPFKASFMSIEARDRDEHPLNTNSCHDCSSIGIQPLPAGLDHFVTTVALPNPGDQARVYSIPLKRGLGF